MCFMDLIVPCRKFVPSCRLWGVTSRVIEVIWRVKGILDRLLAGTAWEPSALVIVFVLCYRDRQNYEINALVLCCELKLIHFETRPIKSCWPVELSKLIFKSTMFTVDVFFECSWSYKRIEDVYNLPPGRMILPYPVTKFCYLSCSSDILASPDGWDEGTQHLLLFPPPALEENFQWPQRQKRE